MVYILENVDDFEEQMKDGTEHLRIWLREQLSPIIDTDSFEEGLYAHLTGGYGGTDANYIPLRLKDSLGIT